MINVKYELTSETVTTEDNRVLHRIRALRNIGNYARKGDLGGFVESDRNLDTEGDAWITDDAKVYRSGHVTGEALVSENAVVGQHGFIMEKAQISGHAYIFDAAIISTNAKISGNAEVGGYAHVAGNAEVTDNAIVKEQAYVAGTAKIGGKAEVSGNANVCYGSEISEDAIIADTSDYHFEAVGDEGRGITAFRTARGEVLMHFDIFTETIEEFKKHSEKTYRNNREVLKKCRKAVSHAEKYLAR